MSRAAAQDETAMNDTMQLNSVPQPAVPGPEMSALRQFFRDTTWKGTIAAGSMGPGTPEMTAVGRGTHRVIQGGLWIVGDYQQDQYLSDGTFVLRWQLHWVVGWDRDACAYRATHADNYGHAGVMHGRLEDNVLTFETPTGSTPRLRMAWDLSDLSSPKWRNECSVGGAPFSLIEAYALSFVESA